MKRGASAKRRCEARKKATAKKPAARKPAARKPSREEACRAEAGSGSSSTAAAAGAAARRSVGSRRSRSGPARAQGDIDWSFREMVKRHRPQRPPDAGRDRRRRPRPRADRRRGALAEREHQHRRSPETSSETSTTVVDDVADEGGPKQAPKAKTNAATAAAAPAEIVNPSRDREQALSIGAQIKPQSTSLPNGNPNTWTGVTKDSIKFAIAYDESACGVNTLTLAQQASANLATSGRYYRAAPKNQEGFRSEFREAAKQLVERREPSRARGCRGLPADPEAHGRRPDAPLLRPKDRIRSWSTAARISAPRRRPLRRSRSSRRSSRSS